MNAADIKGAFYQKKLAAEVHPDAWHLAEEIKTAR